MRRALSLVAGAATAALGALILGEYELSGYVPWVGGVVLGILVAEVMLAVGGHRDWATAGPAAALAALGILWAGWITSGEGIAPYPALAFLAAALAAAAAAFQARPRRPQAEAPSPR